MRACVPELRRTRASWGLRLGRLRGTRRACPACERAARSTFLAWLAWLAYLGLRHATVRDGGALDAGLLGPAGGAASSCTGSVPRRGVRNRPRRQVSGSAAAGKVVPEALRADEADDEYRCADDGVEQEIHSQGPFAGVLVGM